MSNFKFCPNCGAKLEYSFAAPKFCASCGGSLSRGTVLETGPATPANVKSKSQEGVDGMTDAASIPHIEKLDASVDFESNVLTMNFDDESGLTFKEKKFDKRSTSF